MSTLRAGILGTGSIAHKHAQALAAVDQVELVALCGRDESKVRAFAVDEHFTEAGIFMDLREMLDRANLDLMIVCLPPFAHTNQVELAAERGVHLLVEKPMALTSEQAWRMVAAAERAHIKTASGFMYRFGAAVEAFRQRVPRGTAGLFSGRFFCNSLHAPWWRSRAHSGGQVVEQAIHLFDLMRYLVGDPVSVYSRQSNFFHRAVPGYDSDDASATVCGFAGGAIGVIYATNGAVPSRWVKEWRIVTPALLGEFEDWNHATLTSTDVSGGAPQTITSDQNVFELQLQDLVSAIRTGGETRAPLRDGAMTLDVVLAAVRSAQTHSEVNLPQ